MYATNNIVNKENITENFIKLAKNYIEKEITYKNIENFSSEYKNEIELVINLLIDQKNEKIGNLTNLQLFVLRERLGINNDNTSKTLANVGTLVNVTRERIRQIEQTAMLNLISRIIITNKILRINDFSFTFDIQKYIFNNNNLNKISDYFKIEKDEKYAYEIQEIKDKVSLYFLTDTTKYKDITMPIEILNFSKRSYNALKRVGINKICDLTTRSTKEIKNIRGLGKKTYTEIINTFHSYGYKFYDEIYNSNTNTKIKKDKKTYYTLKKEIIEEKEKLYIEFKIALEEKKKLIQKENEIDKKLNELLLKIKECDFEIEKGKRNIKKCKF